MLLGVNTTSGLRHGRKRLPPKQMEILRRIGRLADLEIVARRQLQEAFDARAGVFRALPFVAVRQQQHDAGKQSPLVFAGADELVDDCLRDVDEVAELRLPQHQRLGIIAAVAVFETQHAGFGQRRVVDLATRLVCRDVLRAERIPASFSISISTEWRWLKVPRRLSCPLSRTGMPAFTRLPNASASAMP